MLQMGKYKQPLVLFVSACFYVISLVFHANDLIDDDGDSCINEHLFAELSQYFLIQVV